MVTYKVDIHSDGNVMTFYLFTELFPSATMDQLVPTKMQLS